MKKTVLSVFGTRPEAIKMCPLVNELKSRPQFNPLVCVTAQHRSMLDSVLNTFGILPELDLNIMQEEQTLPSLTARILEEMTAVLDRIKPDIVLVHGDTTTTFAAALACFYKQIPVGHVEAGLRTDNIYSPFPEEFNRQAVGLLARLHFAPTHKAKNALISEGKPPQNIFVTGNTAIDALRTTVRKEYFHPQLEWAKDSRLVLLTAHRRENIGNRMHTMFRAIRRTAEEVEDIKIIFPIHKNKKVREIAAKELGECERIHIIEPLDVIDFHNFMARSCLVLTDSGGIQEEAPSLGKPTLVMRDTTERPEGVEAGTIRLVGNDEERIYKSFSELLSNKEIYNKMAHTANPYGDGTASKKIADILSAIL